jgi:hypothetical protein
VLGAESGVRQPAPGNGHSKFTGRLTSVPDRKTPTLDLEVPMKAMTHQARS